MLTLELQARSIVFESGERGGQTYPKILDQPKNIKKKSWTIFIRGGRGGVVPKTSISNFIGNFVKFTLFFFKVWEANYIFIQIFILTY